MLGGGVRFFPIQNICHWRGYKCSRSAFIFAMYFHCMGVYCRLSIRCTVELWIFRLRLLRPLLTLRLLCRFWLVVASPLMLSVFHSVSLTVAPIPIHVPGKHRLGAGLGKLACPTWNISNVGKGKSNTSTRIMLAVGIIRIWKQGIQDMEVQKMK